MLSSDQLHEAFTQSSDTRLLKAVVKFLRPKKLRNQQEATHNLEKLTVWLGAHPQKKYQLRKAMTSLILQSDMQFVFSESGLQTNSGFFAELHQKFVEKFLPTLLPDKDLRIAIRKIFFKSTDFIWINQIQESAWFHFFNTMRLHVHFNNAAQIKQLVSAAEILSYRIATLGLDKRITQRAGEILQPHNAFVEQNKEWHRYSRLIDAGVLKEESMHLVSNMLQWMDAAMRQVKEIRRQKKEKGTSLQQTFIVERLEQHLERLQIIITIIDPSIDVNPQQYIRYFREVVENENTHNKLYTFLSKNFSYLAYQIAEHGSRTGEKYITNNFKEYRQFFWSAVIGGFIISLAAFIKVGLTNLHFAYFWASFCYGLNYALAFVIIHFLHGTIATKQPALTASTIATALDNTNPKSPSLHNLALMNAKVIRSQLASLLGNLVVVLPFTIFIAWLMHKATGSLLIPTADIDKTLDTVRPHIENIWYAAVAGVLLFLSGIISGYFDNMVIYGNIPKRLTHHKGFQKIFGEKMLAKIAYYTDKNLGALMGNIMLGFGLGFMIFFGKIFALPLDIRHVTISTGFFGFAWYSAAFHLTWQAVVWCISGLMCIAVTNLLVSFALALYTALKSRHIATREIIPLAKITIRYFFRYPVDFVMPPKRERKEEALWRKIEKQRQAKTAIPKEEPTENAVSL